MTQAHRGILVTPIGVQAGAEKIANAENVVVVRLGENSSTKNYLLQFLNKVFIGATDEAHVSENAIVKISSTK